MKAPVRRLKSANAAPPFSLVIEVDPVVMEVILMPICEGWKS